MDDNRHVIPKMITRILTKPGPAEGGHLLVADLDHPGVTAAKDGPFCYERSDLQYGLNLRSQEAVIADVVIGALPPGESILIWHAMAPTAGIHKDPRPEGKWYASTGKSDHGGGAGHRRDRISAAPASASDPVSCQWAGANFTQGSQVNSNGAVFHCDSTTADNSAIWVPDGMSATTGTAVDGSYTGQDPSGYSTGATLLGQNDGEAWILGSAWDDVGTWDDFVSGEPCLDSSCDGGGGDPGQLLG